MAKIFPSPDDIDLYLRCLSHSVYMWGEAHHKDAENMHDMSLNRLKSCLNYINIHLPSSIEGMHKELFKKARARKINELKTAIKALEECISKHKVATFDPEKVNLSSFGKLGSFLVEYEKNLEITF